MVLFVDENRESYGVEPICRMLPIACAPKKVDPALIAKARESAAVPSQRSVTLGLR